MLKRKLSKEEFDALPEGQKAFYAVDPGNAAAYLLQVEPDTDNAALKSAKQREKERADKAEADLATATTRIEELETQVASGKPEIEKIQQQYRDKEAALKTKHAADLKVKDDQLSEVLVKNVALDMAARISTTPELFVPIIEKRLKADLSGTSPRTTVLDPDGTVSTLTIEDLSKELVANPKYAGIIIASNGSGGGAHPNLSGGGAPLNGGKKFDDLSEAERNDWVKKDKAGFEAASKANREAKRRF